jgi:hypothetical protein
MPLQLGVDSAKKPISGGPLALTSLNDWGGVPRSPRPTPGNPIVATPPGRRWVRLTLLHKRFGQWVLSTGRMSLLEGRNYARHGTRLKRAKGTGAVGPRVAIVGATTCDNGKAA